MRKSAKKNYKSASELLEKKTENLKQKKKKNKESTKKNYFNLIFRGPLKKKLIRVRLKSRKKWPSRRLMTKFKIIRKFP